MQKYHQIQESTRNEITQTTRIYAKISENTKIYQKLRNPKQKLPESIRKNYV